MQQLLCQLAVSQRWVQKQVLLSAGQAPSTLFFLVTGQVRPWAGECPVWTAALTGSPPEKCDTSMTYVL